MKSYVMKLSVIIQAFIAHQNHLTQMRSITFVYFTLNNIIKEMEFFCWQVSESDIRIPKMIFFWADRTCPFSKGISSKIKFEFEYSINKEKIKFTKNRSSKSFTKNVTLTSEIQNSIEIFKLNNDFDKKILKKDTKN